MSAVPTEPQVQEPAIAEKETSIIEPQVTPTTPFNSAPPPNKSGLKLKYRRSWKEKLAFLQNFKFFAIFVVPISLTFLIFISGPVIGPGSQNYMHCFEGLSVLLVTGSYFLVDCMPLPAAAVFPAIAYPLFKIVVAGSFQTIYMKDANLMSFATILLVLSGWSAGLTNRAALKILALSCGDFRKCSFLVITLSALFSMWYPDTSVMMFMMDVMEKMVVELKSSINLGSMGDRRMSVMKIVEENNRVTADPVAVKTEELKVQENPVEGSDQAKTEDKHLGNDEAPRHDQEANKIDRRQSAFQEARFNAENDYILNAFKIRVLHSVGIVVNIGGLFWPYCSTGTIQLSGKVSIGAWLRFTGPVIAILLPFTIWYLDFYTFTYPFMSFKRGEKKLVQAELKKRILLDMETSETNRDMLESFYREKYAALGKFSSHEIGVIILLVSTEALFVVSDYMFQGAWSRNLPRHASANLHVKVSTIAMLAAVFASVFPKNPNEMFKRPKDPTDQASFTALLGWKMVQANYPWGLPIFIGGGLAIARLADTSHLTGYISYIILKLEKNNPSPCLYLLVLMLLAFFLACLVSNTAAVGIVFPITNHINDALHKRSAKLPLWPCIAVTAFAFLTPAGTPALAFLHMRTPEMHLGRYFKMGLLLAIVCFVVIYACGVCWIFLS